MGNNYEYEAYICFKNISISILNYEYKKSLFKTNVSFKLCLKNHNHRKWFCFLSLDYPPYGYSGIKKTKNYLLDEDEVYISYDLEFKGDEMRLVLGPADYQNPPSPIDDIIGTSFSYPVVYINLGKKPKFEDSDERVDGLYYQMGYRSRD